MKRPSAKAAMLPTLERGMRLEWRVRNYTTGFGRAHSRVLVGRDGVEVATIACEACPYVRSRLVRGGAR